jgi:hypothetical protein
MERSGRNSNITRQTPLFSMTVVHPIYVFGLALSLTWPSFSSTEYSTAGQP